MSFFADLPNFAFLQLALAAGLVASVASGVVGTLIVVRRTTAVAGAIAHSVLGGLGLARYLEVVHGWSWLSPMHGAVFAALLSAGLIAYARSRAKEREDTAISATWALGMGLGILLLARTPGYNQDLLGYLFGNVLLASRGDLAVMVVLDLVIVGTVLLFSRQILALSYDAEYARLRGVPVEVFSLLLLALTALTVVVLVTVVGIVLVIALLTIPAAIAGQRARTLGQMMIVATLLSASLTTGGLVISYEPDLPPGATIIVLSGGVYLATLAWRAWSTRRIRSA